MNRFSLLGLTGLLLLGSFLPACADRDAASPVETTILFGIGTTPGFSDWITEPTVFTDPIQEIPDPDGVNPPVSLLRSGFVGGVYGFDSNDDGEFTSS